MFKRFNIKVLAFPKLKGHENPNILNLYKKIENNKNISIDEFTILSPFTKKYDIFHIHWPDYFFVKSIVFSILRITYFFLINIIFKFNKTKIIWTIHNLRPHENYHPKFYKFLVSIWLKNIHGFISMSKEAKKLACKEYPILKRKKSSIIYHGFYENYKNETSKFKSRKKLHIPQKKKVLLFFGSIKLYKNVINLVNEFNKLDESYVLIIAGNCKDNELVKQIKNTKKNNKNNKNIKLFIKYIKINEVQFFFNSSDLVILPFKDILNSGSIMLALTFSKPIYCPNLGSLNELKKIVGKNFIHTYNDFSINDIKSIIKKKHATDEIKIKKFDNKFLSKKVISLYKQIV